MKSSILIFPPYPLPEEARCRIERRLDRNKFRKKYGSLCISEAMWSSFINSRIKYRSFGSPNTA
jgi:hypothetical protein